MGFKVGDKVRASAKFKKEFPRDNAGKGVHTVVELLTDWPFADVCCELESGGEGDFFFDELELVESD